MYATLKVKPRLILAGRLNRNHRALDTMTTDQLGELRARMVNAAMDRAIRGQLVFARLYASVAQQCDRMTGSPYALSPEAWEALLLSYARKVEA